MSPLPQHPTAEQMVADIATRSQQRAIATHLQAAFEAAGLLVQAMADDPLQYAAGRAYGELIYLMKRKGLK